MSERTFLTSERNRERARLWQKAHPERHREACLRAKRKYRKTAKGRAMTHAYKSTEKYRAYDREYKRRRYAEGHRPQMQYWRSEKGQNKYLLRRFGISLDEKKRMYEEQKGLCKLCEEPLLSELRRVPTDHCHKTGKVRGLIHHSCNVLIALIEKRPKILKNVSGYLEN